MMQIRNNIRNTSKAFGLMSSTYNQIILYRTRYINRHFTQILYPIYVQIIYCTRYRMCGIIEMEVLLYASI